MKKRNPLKMAIALCLSLVVLAAGFSGCSTTAPADSAKASESTSAQAATGGGGDAAAGTATMEKELEAPMLAEQVKAGTLPKLEERLPAADDIMVEPDIQSIGQYGGSITSLSNDSGHWNWGPFAEQSMFRFKQNGSGEVEPNVAKAFYANDDATVWTIELRKGMKWSDGKPFTADDVVFYYDHMSTPKLNEDRTAADVESEGYYPAYTSKPYNCYQIKKDGKKYWAKVEKVDDYKVTVTFAAPKADFPMSVAVDNKWMFLPKHFYTKYVARKDGVTDDASFPLITEEQAIANANRDFGKQWDKYSTMGKDIGYYNWDYAIVPQLRSFIAVKDNWNTVGETYELVRNPYFWKTDSEGRQLPYLDSLKFLIVNDADQIVLKQTAGEVDLSTASAEDYATVVTATQGTHSVAQWITPSWSSGPSLALCQTVQDPDKRALFQDIRFREALSISVDRNLMNATLMNGQAKPAQMSVPEGAPGYNAAWQAKWTEFDVEKANGLLDQLTEPWDRKEGTYRKMKGSGKELEIVITIKDPSTEGDAIALLQSAYKAVGVKISDKVDAEVAKAILVNNIDAVFESFGLTTPAIRPDSVVPMRNFMAWYGAYGKWYEDGRSTANGGVEPTGDVLELINAYEAIKTASGKDRDKIVTDSVQKIYDLHEKNVWVIGFLSPLPMDWIVNNKVRNLPSGIVHADEYRFASMMRPEQLYREP